MPASTPFIAVLLAVATWPTSTAALAPQAGLDTSWQAALAMAARHRIPFGTRIVWTYGPLGFLTTPTLYFTGTTALAVVFRFGLAIPTFAILVHALRRRTNLALATIVAYVAGYPMVAMWGGIEVTLLFALVSCVYVLSCPTDAWTSRWVWVGSGTMAGLVLLQKLPLGIVICVLTAVAIACSSLGRRLVAVGLTLSSLVAVFALGWFASGNGFGNLVAYGRAVSQAASGFSAMELNTTSQGHDLLLAVVAGAAILVLAGFYARRLPRPAAIGVVISTALVTWTLFKEGYVRQDFHRVVFFAATPLLLSALLLGADARRRAGLDPSLPSPKRTATVMTVLMGSALVAFTVAGSVPPGLVDPGASIGGLAGTLHTLVSPAHRHHTMQEARAALRLMYAVPAPMLARLSGQRVDIDPIEQTVAWAYPEMRWDPLPTIQDYFAYTSALDRLDVSFIGSRDAPRYILRAIPSSIDGRLPIFDAPSTQVAIECNYREVAVSRVWQLVERVPDRCGPMRERARVRAVSGKPVTVPAVRPGTMIVATFDLHLAPTYRLVDLAYRAPQITIDVDGSPTANRFIAATASDLHVLSSASTLGYHAPFAPPPIHRLALSATGFGHAAPRATITFYEIPLR